MLPIMGNTEEAIRGRDSPINQIQSKTSVNWTFTDLIVEYTLLVNEQFFLVSWIVLPHIGDLMQVAGHVF